MKAYLILENGMVFTGTRIGSPAESTGELVFTTGVVGYMETLSDPSYAGQIIMQTFPLIGNYGVITEDMQGDFANVSRLSGDQYSFGILGGDCQLIIAVKFSIQLISITNLIHN